jgi:hypothetical protein
LTRRATSEAESVLYLRMLACILCSFSLNSDEIAANRRSSIVIVFHCLLPKFETVKRLVGSVRRRDPACSAADINACHPEHQPLRTNWWLLAVLIGLPVLLAMVGQAGSRAAATQPPTPWVEVRRALPAVPHALPSTVAPVAAQWQSIRMPDGTIVSASFQGWLPSSADLPNAGHFLGEEFATGTVANPTAWIWMTRAGALSPSWVDP